MGGRSLLIHSRHFQRYQLSDEHPFNPLRLELTETLIKAMGLWPEKALEARGATFEELVLFHSPAYVNAVFSLGEKGECSLGPEAWGLGTEDNPVFPRMGQAAALLVGASIQGAELILAGNAEHVLNYAGGLHHAHREQASGFCVFNDIVLAIKKFCQAGWRVVYIDTDAHHGDGVQWAFYDNPQVLTISLHETGRYLFPGTGKITELGQGAGYGYSINLPLEPFSDTASMLECFQLLLPPLLEAFKPDVIVSQHGCDTHYLDPLTHLHGDMHLLRAYAELIHGYAHQYSGGRWLALGGGGYDIWRVVPRAWTLLWATLSHQLCLPAVPASWLEQWQGGAPVPLPAMMMDPEDMVKPIPRQQEIREKNLANAQRVLQNAYPIIAGIIG
ncbi:MAG: acetoin utilization protein AcuC [Bacillota bacterium]